MVIVDQEENSFTLNSKHSSSKDHLSEFERDPEIALLALAANSGQDRFSSVDLLDENTTIEDDNCLVLQLKEEIANLKPEDVSKILETFQWEFNKNANLVGCGCCGVRAYEMGTVKYHSVLVQNLQPLELTKLQKDSYKRIADLRKIEKRVCFPRQQLLSSSPGAR